MSPILVRPVREQLEHDRIIRLLQAKFRRKYEAGMNPGAEQNAAGRHRSIRALSGPRPVCRTERGRRLQAVVEVETGESVNHLEALAQWAHFAEAPRGVSPLRPCGMVDVARRLCEDNQIHVTEIWSYHASATRRGSRWCIAAARHRRSGESASGGDSRRRGGPSKSGARRPHAAAGGETGREARGQTGHSASRPSRSRRHRRRRPQPQLPSRRQRPRSPRRPRPRRRE